MQVDILLAVTYYLEHAPVVKWISQRSSEPSFQVRVLAGAQKGREVVGLASKCMHSRAIVAFEADMV